MILMNGLIFNEMTNNYSKNNLNILEIIFLFNLYKIFINNNKIL